MDEITKKNIASYDSTVKEYYSYTKKLEGPQIKNREEFMSVNYLPLKRQASDF